MKGRSGLFFKQATDFDPAQRWRASEKLRDTDRAVTSASGPFCELQPRLLSIAPNSQRMTSYAILRAAALRALWQLARERMFYGDYRRAFFVAQDPWQTLPHWGTTAHPGTPARHVAITHESSPRVIDYLSA